MTTAVDPTAYAALHDDAGRPLAVVPEAVEDQRRDATPSARLARLSTVAPDLVPERLRTAVKMASGRSDFTERLRSARTAADEALRAAVAAGDLAAAQNAAVRLLALTRVAECAPPVVEQDELGDALSEAIGGARHVLVELDRSMPQSLRLDEEQAEYGRLAHARPYEARYIAPPTIAPEDEQATVARDLAAESMAALPPVIAQWRADAQVAATDRFDLLLRAGQILEQHATARGLVTEANTLIAQANENRVTSGHCWNATPVYH
jgi:hypothetical protein